jgi:hypothetical protein
MKFGFIANLPAAVRRSVENTPTPCTRPTRPRGARLCPTQRTRRGHAANVGSVPKRRPTEAATANIAKLPELLRK